MGLFNTIANALGIRRALRVKPRDSLDISPAARQFLDALGEGQFVALSTTLKDGMYSIHVTPCTSAGAGPSPHPKLHISDDDAERVKGLGLDMEQGRWRMIADLRVDGLDTPNPNGRKYQTDRIFHRGAPAFFTVPHTSPPLARLLLESKHIVSVLFRENEISIERPSSSTWDEVDRVVDGGLRYALLRCAPIVEAIAAPTFNTELEQRVWAVIESTVLPAIHRDGGDLQLLEVTDGVVKVTLRGACASCPASTLTLKGGVERQLVNAFPTEIVRVEAI